MTCRCNVADSGLVRGRMYLLLHFCEGYGFVPTSYPHQIQRTAQIHNMAAIVNGGGH